MFKFTHVFSLHTAAASAVMLGFAGGAGLAVATDVKFDEFEQYETAFMSACTAWNSDQTCSCAMASIEDQIGFEQFARATERSNGDLFDDQRWDQMAYRAVETCSALALPVNE